QFHLFSPDGELRVAGGVCDDRVSNVAAVVRTPDGWLAAQQEGLTGQSRDNPGPYRDTTTIRRFHLSSSISEPIARFAGRETYLLGEIGFYIYPFRAPVPQVVIGRDARIYFTGGDKYRIDVHAFDGSGSGDGAPGPTLVRRITGEVDRVPMTDAEYEADYRAQLARYEDRRPLQGEAAMAHAMLVNEYPSVPGAQFVPVVGRMLVDEDGRILLERLDLEPVAWDLLAADGRIAGRVRLPYPFTPRRLTPRHLYGVLRDELDVQYVVRYRLRPAI
ncbi:MAG: hypothetical protein WD054_05380, partial [Gemmatimonadota bacterium]